MSSVRLQAASRRWQPRLVGLAVVPLLLAACSSGPSTSAPASSATSAPAAAAANSGGAVSVGLITKTETNPFFVKMKEGADKEATAKGVKLVSAAGKFDGDNQGQVTAIENMVTAGVKGILITPSDTKAIVPSIKKARDAGVLVIALDTPTEPQDATDALFATDNKQAGILIGTYAKSAEGGKPVKIATLDLAPGISVGVLRHDGFIQGFGITNTDPQVVCSQDTQGDQAKGQAAMETCLQKDPAINLVYTINEPAAMVPSLTARTPAQPPSTETIIASLSLPAALGAVLAPIAAGSLMV
jgi:fructose transport system substrate-binding protein